MSAVGDRIRMMRRRAGLTLEDVAKHLGIGKQAVYKYEKGTVTNIPLDNIEKMAEIFGTTPEYLSGWTADDRHIEMDLQLFADRNLSYDEQNLVNDFRSLSVRGQQLLIDRAEELKLLYGKKSEGGPALPLQKP